MFLRICSCVHASFVHAMAARLPKQRVDEWIDLLIQENPRLTKREAREQARTWVETELKMEEDPEPKLARTEPTASPGPLQPSPASPACAPELHRGPLQPSPASPACALELCAASSPSLLLKRPVPTQEEALVQLGFKSCLPATAAGSVPTQEEALDLVQELLACNSCGPSSSGDALDTLPMLPILPTAPANSITYYG